MSNDLIDFMLEQSSPDNSPTHREKETNQSLDNNEASQQETFENSKQNQSVEDWESGDDEEDLFRLRESSPSNSIVRKLPEWMLEKDAVLAKQQLEATSRREIKHLYKNAACQEVQTSDLYSYRDALNPFRSGRVICFDLETTGFSNTDSIIDIGAVELIDGFRTGVCFRSYVKPRGEIHPKAQAVHGITLETLSTAPAPEILISSFLAWIGISPLVVHNSRFDMRMLFLELSRLGLSKFLNERDVFCTMRYHRFRSPGKSYSLVDVAIHYGVSLKGFRGHGALEDAELLSKIYLKMMDDCVR